MESKWKPIRISVVKSARICLEHRNNIIGQCKSDRVCVVCSAGFGRRSILRMHRIQRLQANRVGGLRILRCLRTQSSPGPKQCRYPWSGVETHLSEAPGTTTKEWQDSQISAPTAGSDYLKATLLGGPCEQAILSVTPDEILAQAVSLAVRCASWRVVPAAVAQAVCPRNSMHTSQRN